MREIKFRAWDKSDNMMYYGIENGITFDDGSEYTFKDFLNNQGYHEWEIMQFTGLKDKNGREIYEGDIVNYSDKVSIVTYANGCFSFRGFCAPCEPLYHYKIFEIIGNIYENSDLLKEAQ